MAKLTQIEQVKAPPAVSGEKYTGSLLDLITSAGDPTPAFATATITVTAAPIVSGSIDIGGRTLTSFAGARTSGSDNFNRTLGTTTALATEIAAAINDLANTFIGSPAVTAVAIGSVVTLTSLLPGSVGNRTTLSENIAAVTISGPYLTGGWDGPGTSARNLLSLFAVPIGAGTITIGGTVLTGVAGARTSGSNDFDRTKGTVDLESIEIARAINDPANTFDTTPGVVAYVDSQNTSIVRLFAKTAGTGGNSITLAKTTANLFRAFATFDQGQTGQVAGPLVLNVGTLGGISATSTGGPRGFQSVDLQASRTSDSQVAGANRSAIIGGYNNAIIGFGSYNSAILGGHDNIIDSTVSLTYNSVIIGGYENVIRPKLQYGNQDSTGCFIGPGYQNTIADRAYGSAIFGSGNTIDGGANYSCGQAFITGLLNGIYGENTVGGSYHSVAMGRLNEIHGSQDSFAFGRFNYIGGVAPAYGSCSFAGGNSNTVRSYETFVWGANNATHTRASRSSALGSGAYTYVVGQQSHGSGNTGFGVGKQQACEYTVFNSTTNATPTELAPGGFPGVDRRLFVQVSRTYAFRIQVSARQTAGAAGTVGDSATWEVQGAIKRDGANNTVLIGVPTGTGTPLFSDAAAATWSIAVTADDTNESLKVNVTGEVSKTIHWLAAVYTAEVG